MAGRHVTRAGDALDLICHREYGQQAGAVETVLEANPHIKDIAHRMPAGVTVILPDIASPTAASGVRLWD